MGGRAVGSVDRFGEAVELRDGDAARYGGKGTRQAVQNVNGEVAELTNAGNTLSTTDPRHER